MIFVSNASKTDQFPTYPDQHRQAVYGHLFRLTIIPGFAAPTTAVRRYLPSSINTRPYIQKLAKIGGFPYPGSHTINKLKHKKILRIIFVFL